MKNLLKKFEEKRSEDVFAWKHSQTDAEGWPVINSLQGEAACGGMRNDLNKSEVVAKTMEVKFTVSGRAVGEAKSGINFNSSNSHKKEVLQRRHKAVMPLLKNGYKTENDLIANKIYQDFFQRLINSFKKQLL